MFRVGCLSVSFRNSAILFVRKIFKKNSFFFDFDSTELTRRKRRFFFFLDRLPSRAESLGGAGVGRVAGAAGGAKEKTRQVVPPRKSKAPNAPPPKNPKGGQK